MAKYWADYPPVHIILGGLIGKKEAGAATPSTEADVMGLLNSLNPQQVGPPQHGT